MQNCASNVTERTSMNVLWIRNCSAYSEPKIVTCVRRASGQPADTAVALHMQQRVAGGRHGRHLDSMTSYQIRLLQSMCIYLKNNPAKFRPAPF